MRPLIIDDTAKERIAEIVRFAEENIYRPGKNENPPGDDARHVIKLFIGFRAVYSLTEGPEGNLYRHLSISVDGPSYPNPIAAYTIAEAFGFTGWTLDMGEKPGPDWMLHVDREDHCIVLAQKR